MKKYAIYNSQGTIVRFIFANYEVAEREARELDFVEVSTEFDDESVLSVDLSSQPTVIKSLDLVKKKKRMEVDGLRESVQARGVEYQGCIYQSDAEAVSNITAALTTVNAGLPLPDGFAWRTFDNENIPFTATDITGLAAAMLTRKNLCYGVSWALKGQIDALTSVEDVEVLDVNKPWVDV